jgi:hypothetical protein
MHAVHSANLPVRTIVFGLCALSLCVASLAQTPQTAATTGKYTLKEGTDVRLKFADDISSKTAALDDPVTLILDEDLRVGDVVVARAGAKAVATVSNVKKAGMMGKAGELNIRLESMKVGSYKVRLRGTKGREGDSKVGTAVVLTVLFGPIGLIKHGKNVEVKQGTPLGAYVADDVDLPPVDGGAAAPGSSAGQ